MIPLKCVWTEMWPKQSTMFTSTRWELYERSRAFRAIIFMAHSVKPVSHLHCKASFFFHKCHEQVVIAGVNEEQILHNVFFCFVLN